MEQHLIDKMRFLNHEEDMSKAALNKAIENKEFFIKNLIDTASFKKNEIVLYDNYKYEIDDVDFIYRGAGIPDTPEMEIIYRLHRIGAIWDTLTIFERDVKNLRKL